MSGDKDKADRKKGDNPERDVEEFLGRLFAGEPEEEKLTAVRENLLAAKLRERIEVEGPITLHDYMEACLSDPQFGYYFVRDPFGTGGDFITAPDVCQIFGELIGLWCVHVWAELGQPMGCKLIEMGPGRGALMSDALRAASLVPEFLQNIEVHFVETSKALCKAQEENIRATAKDHGRALPKLVWHERLEDVPAGPTFLVANEFLDALPIRQYQLKEGHWFERMIVLDKDKAFSYGLADEPIEDPGNLPPIHAKAVEGDFVEQCPASRSFVAQLAKRASTHPLAALLIDYGYGEPALGETFQAIANHKFTDPLLEPGLADVTAHVDFSQLLEAGQELGLTVSGPRSQRDFLIALGARERAAQLMEGMENMPAAQQFLAGFQRLIQRDQMGELFKAVAFAGADQPVLPGFEKLGEQDLPGDLI